MDLGKYGMFACLLNDALSGQVIVVFEGWVVDNLVVMYYVRGRLHRVPFLLPLPSPSPSCFEFPLEKQLPLENLLLVAVVVARDL